jgi:hypothetical protein
MGGIVEQQVQAEKPTMKLLERAFHERKLAGSIPELMQRVSTV